MPQVSTSRELSRLEMLEMPLPRINRGGEERSGRHHWKKGQHVICLRELTL